MLRSGRLPGSSRWVWSWGPLKGPQKLVELIHSRYRSKPILYERVYHTEYEMAPNWRLDPWDGSNCHPKYAPPPPPPPQGMKMVLLIHWRYQLKPISYERVYPPEYEITHNWRFEPWVDPDCHPKPDRGQRRVELIHSRYRSKPILYERVYHTEYEMAPNWCLDPWDGSNCHPKDAPPPPPPRYENGFIHTFDVPVETHFIWKSISHRNWNGP